MFCYLEEELLVAGPPLPSRLASPGPARAPRPSRTNHSGQGGSANVFTQTDTQTFFSARSCSPSPPSPVGPISCISWLWDMFPNRFCSPPSPPRADSSCPLPPTLPGAPGIGGLFRYSLTLRQNSSSLSLFGSYRGIKSQMKHARLTWNNNYY